MNDPFKSGFIKRANEWGLSDKEAEGLWGNIAGALSGIKNHLMPPPKPPQITVSPKVQTPPPANGIYMGPEETIDPNASMTITGTTPAPAPVQPATAPLPEYLKNRLVTGPSQMGGTWEATK